MGDNLTEVLEQLVEAISGLIMAVITENFDDVKTHCLTLAKTTNQIVHIIQTIAIESRDVDFQESATKVITHIATSVSSLVTAFNNLVDDPLADHNKKAFAMASKDVGEAINALMIVTDKSNSAKLAKHIGKMLLSTENLASGVKSRKTSELPTFVNEAKDKNQELLIIASRVIKSTADPTKKQKLTESLDLVKRAGPDFLKQAEQSLSSSHPQDIDPATSRAINAFKSLLSACNIDPLSYIKKVHETVEYIQKLLELSEELKQASRALRGVVIGHGSHEDFVSAAKRMATTALALAKQASVTASKTDDPVQRLRIEELSAEIKTLSTQLIDAAKKVQMNPNDLKAKEELDDCYRHLDGAINKLQWILEGREEDPLIKLASDIHYLEHKGAQMAEAALKSHKDQFVSGAREVGAIIGQLEKDAVAVTKSGNLSNEESRILNSAIVSAKNSAGAFVSAGKNVIDSNNAQNSKKLTEAQKDFLKKLLDVKRAAKITDSTEAAAGIVIGDNELLAAALEEVQMALLLANEADPIAKHLSNSNQRDQAILSIAELRELANLVRRCAEIVAQFPDDPKAQRDLAEAQKKLAAAVLKVVGLTSKQGGELNQAMSDMNSAANLENDSAVQIVNASKELIELIEKYFGKSKIDAKEKVMGAREIAEKVNQIAKMLREMATTSKDDQTKETLIDYSKVMRDRAIQVKIISAVQASGDSKTDAANSAASGLAGTVKELLNVLCAASLKRRVAATLNQVSALKRILEIWKKNIL